MSYDCYMMMDTGGPEPACVCEIGNMTSNVSGMWNLALGFPLAPNCSRGKASPESSQAFRHNPHHRDIDHANDHRADTTRRV